jgi:hypothetical protein
VADKGRDRLLADIDAKVAELKAAIHEGNNTLKDLRTERKELKAQLAWALDQHQQVLGTMLERSSEEILCSTRDIMDGVRRQLDDVVQRAQSVQTLTRVDRLLRFVAAQLADAPGDDSNGGGPTGPPPSGEAVTS